MKRPYFAFFPGDYLADTIGMSCCEHGVYILLLAVSWQRGALPDDMDHLSRLAANPPVESLRFVLENYWTLTEHGWINMRLERERKTIEDSYLRRAEAGRKGGLARSSNAKAMPQQSYSIAQATPTPTPTPTPTRIKHTNVCSSPEPSQAPDSGRPATCPHRKIIDLYHKHCTRNPQIRTWQGQRPKLLQARWKEHPSLDWWDGFFEYVAESLFLTGRTQGRSGPFCPGLDWMIRPENFQKINEGMYHRGISTTQN